MPGSTHVGDKQSATGAPAAAELSLLHRRRPTFTGAVPDQVRGPLTGRDPLTSRGYPLANAAPVRPDKEVAVAVVVGYVPTKEGRAALRRAAEEALRRRTSVIVVNSSKPGRPVDSPDRALFDSELRQIQERLDEAGIPHEVRQMLQRGEPSEDLIAVAEEEDADVIVIGLRRRTPVGKLILGSNAQRVLLEAGCAVLAVKAEQVDRAAQEAAERGEVPAS